MPGPWNKRRPAQDRAPAEPPAEKPPWIVRHPKDGSILVLIPAGEFLMGSDPSEDSSTSPDERPQFRLYLPAYYIGMYLITNSQYLKFVAETGYNRGGDSTLRKPSYADFPVTEVDWNDARAYLNWAGLRLPSEAEWEKAARGADGRIYPWGNDWDDERCLHVRNSGRERACRVSDFPAGTSAYGAYSMCGNVWQWCEDWYEDCAYARYSREGYSPPNSGAYRVLRGGAFHLPAGMSRAAYRSRNGPEHRTATGLRAAGSCT